MVAERELRSLCFIARILCAAYILVEGSNKKIAEIRKFWMLFFLQITSVICKSEWENFVYIVLKI